jgi:hypothetical protein
MRALYLIATRPSPTLSDPNCSDDYKSFVNLCLKKIPEERPSVSELLLHPFVNNAVEGTKEYFADYLQEWNSKKK